ncbi:MAG: NAD(+) synthase, partial [Halobacteriovoraceae bacterium]|nr:NAD(+) synthase [Halobacteriovoraceae bacterium]
MQIHCYQTKHSIADFEGFFETLWSALISKDGAGLHLFPELFLCGYPLQDLCLERSFLSGYNKLLLRVNTESQKLPKDSTKILLLGGLDYQMEGELPLKIENCIFQLSPGSALKKIYTKQLLPNYDIFDEKKYFSAGNQTGVVEFEKLRIGLLICEDMWPSSSHPHDPCNDLKKEKQLDLIVNLSASPYQIGKQEKRLQRAREISAALEAPFAYVNRVGGEDEILFDGQSFALNNQSIIKTGGFFAEDKYSFELPKFNKGNEDLVKTDASDNTWETLFSPRLTDSCPPKLPKLSDEECGEIIKALNFGISEYSQKCGFKNYLVALSGGMDSALVLTLLKLQQKTGQFIEAVYMPSEFSSTLSYDLSLELCQKLDIPLTYYPIKFLHSVMRNNFKENFGMPLNGLADENIQSRLRGNLIYARSNQTGALVLNTSNKSELAVGYSTLYGDSVGGISPLGDLYKSEIFQIAEYINRTFDAPIPQGIIDRPPSAELREGQEDAQSLPSYDRLDPMLEGLLSYRLDCEKLTELGFDSKEVEKVYGLYRKSEYKRNQFGPIIKVKPKSFGFGYRVPI